MDFGHRVAPPQGLGKLEVDALVLVVAAGSIDSGLGAPLADLLADAVAEGDLALKKGKTLYLHRPAGFAARRVVVAGRGRCRGQVVQGRGRARHSRRSRAAAPRAWPSPGPAPRR